MCCREAGLRSTARSSSMSGIDDVDVELGDALRIIKHRRGRSELWDVGENCVSVRWGKLCFSGINADPAVRRGAPECLIIWE